MVHLLWLINLPDFQVEAITSGMAYSQNVGDICIDALLASGVPDFNVLDGFTSMIDKLLVENEVQYVTNVWYSWWYSFWAWLEFLSL